MYVCICHAVTDSAIRKAVSEGVRSLRELSFRTGCSTQCGSCAELAQQVLDEALSLPTAPPLVELKVVAS